MLLETARLFLRPFQLQDYSHLHSRHHPTIASHPDHEMTLFDELDLFLTEPKNHPLEKQIRIALILKEKQALIGDLTVTYRDKTLALSFATQPEYQKQGFMHEALTAFLPYLQNHYPALEIVCLVPKNNQISQQLLQNLNFAPVQYLSDFDCHLYTRKNE